MMLLYKKERKQYNDAIVDNVSPSTIYGAEHLLRLFGMILFADSNCIWKKDIVFVHTLCLHCLGGTRLLFILAFDFFS